MKQTIYGNCINVFSFSYCQGDAPIVSLIRPGRSCLLLDLVRPQRLDEVVEVDLFSSSGMRGTW